MTAVGRWLLTPQGVVAALTAYCLGHFALRFALAPGLGIDDAEQALFGQHLAWGYKFRQPPLFTWVAWGAFQVLDPGLLALTLLRYLLLGVTFLALYGTARRVIADPGVAALAAYSYLALYIFAYFSHHDLTHTVMLSAVLALSLYVGVRTVQEGAVWQFAALGLLIGLGFLSKYNYALFVAGAGLATLILPDIRARLLRPALALTVLCAAVVIAPYALWAWDTRLSFLAEALVIVQADAGAGGVLGAAQTLGDLLLKALLFLLPFLVLLPLALPGLVARRAAAPATAPDLRRWLLAQAACGLAVLAVIALATQAGEFKERWFHPILLGLPVALYARLDRMRVSPRRVRAAGAILVTLVGVAATARVVNDQLEPEHCSRCRPYAPLAALAADLADQAGFAGTGVILAPDHHIGGNLAVQWPDAAVLDARSPAYAQTRARPPGPCLVVWGGHRGMPAAVVPDRLAGFAADHLGWAVAGRPAAGTVEAGLIGADHRPYWLSWAPVPGCRAADG